MVESGPADGAGEPALGTVAVAITGTAQFRMQVAARLQRCSDFVVTCPSSLDGAALDGIDAAVHCAHDANVATASFVRSCRAAGIPCVVVRLTPHEAVVAVDVAGDRSAGLPGCPECARLYAERSARSNASVSRARIDPEDTTAAACLVELALCNVLEASSGLRPADEHATVIDFDGRRIGVDTLRRHPACPVCQPAMPASPGALRAEALEWRDRWLHSDSDGGIDLAVLRNRLRVTTGARFALLEPPVLTPPASREAVRAFFRRRGVDPDRHALAQVFVASTADTHGVAGASPRQVCAGCDFDDAAAAEVVALAEGLERVFGLSNRPAHRFVNAPYFRVADQALDPRRIASYDDAQYDAPDFPLRRFDPDAPIDWIWGLDLVSDSPILVACDLVFGGERASTLYRANSNGAACHSSLRQAIVNGICEVVERDALMATWLNGLSLPRAVFGSDAPDPWGLRETLARLEFRLDCVDLTNDLDIPVMLAVLRDGRNPDFMLVNMVAAVDPATRLRKLHRELAQFMHPYLVDRGAFVNACTRDDDPVRVRDFPDHVAYYQSARRHRHADFLTASAATRPFSTPAADSVPLDASATLQQLLERLSAKDYPVIVVDCTAPLLQDLGLHAVKVLIPGLQPLNGGHALRPLGGERLLTFAQRMGESAHRRTPAELNPWPHPFW
jgi:thiazole/oxazole-forming peptide maturase SagD family component